MTQEVFMQNLAQVHMIFKKKQSELTLLQEGIKKSGQAQKELDAFLEVLALEKTEETRYIAYDRIKNRKCTGLDMYLQKLGKTQAERDEAFELSYEEVRTRYENLQKDCVSEIAERGLLTEFYQVILDQSQHIGHAYSDLFLAWHKKIFFEANRDLELRFKNNMDDIIAFLESEKLFDLGYDGEKADRCYSVLEKDGEKYVSRSYACAFFTEVQKITSAYKQLIEKLSACEDDIFHQKNAFIAYYTATIQALQEQNPDHCVEKWARVDALWMEITSPIQPTHMLEYYEDAYRRSVSIEFDVRVVDTSIPKSQVFQSMKNMYEAMYDEIGRENFLESYHYSLGNLEKVQLYTGAPLLIYASFLCSSYSAQVVPNDDKVSQIHGKKIFAFPKSVYESQKSAPRMKIDEIHIENSILEGYENFLQKDFSYYFDIYDRETIGHEYGHSLWLKPGSEVHMNTKGLYKYIEEFKATTGGLVAYFLSGGDEEVDYDMILTHLVRSVRMMRYREVEEVLPYYCECLIHLHIFFTSGLAELHDGKLQLNFKNDHYALFKELYMSVYTQQIFTYLNTMEAGNFLFEFVHEHKGIYLPKHLKARRFVEAYFESYKAIGNTLA